MDEALQTLAEVLTVVRQDEQAGQAPEAPSGTAVNPAQDSPQPAVSGKYVRERNPFQPKPAFRLLLHVYPHRR